MKVKVIQLKKRGENMKETAIFWRESVYKNKFKCNKCGTKLADNDGKCLDGAKVLIGTFENSKSAIVICANCKNTVAHIQATKLLKEGEKNRKVGCESVG